MKHLQKQLHRLVLFTLLITISIYNANAQRIPQQYTVTLHLKDGATGEPLIGASVVWNQKNKTRGVISDIDGIAQFKISQGKRLITVSYIGYQTHQQEIQAKENTSYTIKLKPDSKILEEVVVTASESKGLTSSSKIDRQAMSHLQPSSLTDVLSLLPGESSSDPKMGVANLIRLREAKPKGKDFDFSSLGTGFVIDGVPLSSDANLQTISSGSPANDNRNITSKGIDMRTISMDNVSSVEIIRGIPSVEYGDISTGVVRIKRKDQASPFEFRFKADQFSKLFYAGKGINIGHQKTLNINLDYLDSKTDPRNRSENYKRFTASARLQSNFNLTKGKLQWSSNLDYNGSFDNQKADPEMSEKLDRYRSTFSKFSFNNQLKYITPYRSGLRQLNFTSSLTAQFDKIKQTREVYLNTPSAIPNSLEEGLHDAIYLPNHYISDFKVDGKPLYLFHQLNSHWAFFIGSQQHLIKGGLDYAYNKNRGKGNVYDPTRPPSPTITTRPRRYKDIPALQRFSFYLEDNITIPLNDKRKIEIQAGVRSLMLTGLNGAYKLQNKLHWDPRVNLVYDILNRPIGQHDFNVKLAGGWGILTKLPTMAQLYPDKRYIDLESLNYYHEKPEYRRLMLDTHIRERVNTNLSANRNRKWEVRTDVSWGDYRLSLTYFREKTNSGFRNLTNYLRLPYKRFDTNAIDDSQLTGPPSIENLPYEERVYLTTIGYTGNGSRLDKEGIEFHINTPRFKTIHTRVTLTGGWFKTFYSNSQPHWYEPNVMIEGKRIPYLGLYDWQDSSTHQSLRTQLKFDTHLAKLGLTFSTTIQGGWIDKSTQKPKNPRPSHYIGEKGDIMPYTDSDAEDAVLQWLMLKENTVIKNSIPGYFTINFKANKSFGKRMNISLFVDRILNYTPSYHRNGVKIYRSVSPYFGMEATLKI